MYHCGGDVNHGEGYACKGTRQIQEISVFSAQLCHEPVTSTK